ncbi:hypothetical protein ACH5RR_015575 [Cinchona calisaya]|uniref:Uncharacterized protein n=1 Tax=Cinchona calisaya TaxID=153742 RepID=A0ABD2ZTK6_9GENT
MIPLMSEALWIQEGPCGIPIQENVSILTYEQGQILNHDNSMPDQINIAWDSSTNLIQNAGDTFHISKFNNLHMGVVDDHHLRVRRHVHAKREPYTSTYNIVVHGDTILDRETLSAGFKTFFNEL